MRMAADQLDMEVSKITGSFFYFLIYIANFKIRYIQLRIFIMK